MALEHLAQQKMIKLAENKYLMFGGPQPEAQKEIANATTKALQKFHAWADQVHEVVQTEFPDFELLAAFSVFWLDESMEGTAKRAPHTAGPSRLVTQLPTEACRRLWCAREHIERGVPGPPANRTNIEKPRMHEMTSASAWASALRATQSKATKNGRTSQSNIWRQSASRPVVQRLLVAPGSTTSLEQTFSRKKWLLGEQWNGSPEEDQRQLILQEEVRMKETPDASLSGPPMLAAFGSITWAHHERLATAGRLLWACGPLSTELLRKEKPRPWTLSPRPQPRVVGLPTEEKRWMMR